MASQVSLGLGLQCAVAMFHFAKDLVEENDCHLELIVDDNIIELTAEYVSFIAD
jgi:hypothetical protein